jgi:glycerol-3-phosphate dehydrogenase
LLNGAGSLADLGQVFGADLTEAELRYLAEHEWARTGADVVWRRSKLGLRLNESEILAVDAALADMIAVRETAK